MTALAPPSPVTPTRPPNPIFARARGRDPREASAWSAREILANDLVMGPSHVRGDHPLAWSPAGDRIALGHLGAIYTFATDVWELSHTDWTPLDEACDSCTL